MEKIKRIDGGIEISASIILPFTEGKNFGSDFDLDHARQRGLGLMLDIIGSFSKLLIQSLKARKKACMVKLVSHLDEIEFNDGHHICWPSGDFNVPSYEAMDDAIKALQQGCFKEFVRQKSWVDQTLKALLNDPILDRSSKEGGFKFSQLVSILCELQSCPPEYLP